MPPSDQSAQTLTVAHELAASYLLPVIRGLKVGEDPEDQQVRDFLLDSGEVLLRLNNKHRLPLAVTTTLRSLPDSRLNGFLLAAPHDTSLLADQRDTFLRVQVGRIRKMDFFSVALCTPASSEELKRYAAPVPDEGEISRLIVARKDITFSCGTEPPSISCMDEGGSLYFDPFLADETTPVLSDEDQRRQVIYDGFRTLGELTIASVLELGGHGLSGGEPGSAA